MATGMTKAVSVRASVRQFVREHIEGQGEIRLPDVTQAALAHFWDDPEFVESLFRETIRDIVYDLTQEAVSHSRSGFIATSSGGITPEEMERRARSSPVWSRWMEHAGDRHINLLEMRKGDLLLAAQERRGRAAREEGVAALLTQLAGKLRGRQQVRDRFTEQQITQLYQELQD